jgi:hypothetical protein
MSRKPIELHGKNQWLSVKKGKRFGRLQSLEEDLNKESIIDPDLIGMKISPTPLCQRGVIPSFSKGREGGICLQCLNNYGLINNRI